MRKLDLDDVIGYGLTAFYMLAGIATLIVNFM